MSRRVFISVVNQEHKDFSADLAKVFRRAGLHPIVQPDFPHSTVDTIRKIDALIGRCDLLIHIVGSVTGSTANADCVEDLWQHKQRERFLSRFSKSRELLGDYSHLSYAYWEPWLAKDRGIPVLVYAEEAAMQEGLPSAIQLRALHLSRSPAELLEGPTTRCSQVLEGARNSLFPVWAEPGEAEIQSGFAEPSQEANDEHLKQIRLRAAEHPHRSVIDCEIETLQDNAALMIDASTPSSHPVKSIAREFRRILIAGQTPVAQELRSIYPLADEARPVYVARRIDDHFAAFLAQYQKNLFVFANHSGSGKSTFLAHAANQLSRRNHIVFFLTGSEIALNADNEREILHQTIAGNSSLLPQNMTKALAEFLYQTNPDGTVDLQWDKLRAYARAQRKQIFFFVDAIDRVTFRRGQLATQLTQFLDQLLPADQQGQSNQIRVVMSCRQEVWEEQKLASVFVEEGGAFQPRMFFPDDLLSSVRQTVGSANLETDDDDCVTTKADNQASSQHSLASETTSGWFSARSYEQAFEVYQDAFQLGFGNAEQFRALNESLLKQPLMMRLFFESHRGEKNVVSFRLNEWQLLQRFVLRKRTDILEFVQSRFPQFSITYPYRLELSELITAVILFVSVEMLRGKGNTFEREDLIRRIRARLVSFVEDTPNHRVLDNSLSRDLLGEKGRLFADHLVSSQIDFDILARVLMDAGLSTSLLAKESNGIRFMLDVYYEFCLGRAVGNVILNQTVDVATALNALRSDPAMCLPTESTAAGQIKELPSTQQKTTNREQQGLIDRGRHFIANATRFAFLQTEGSTQHPEGIDSVVDGLAFLAHGDFDAQKLACEIISELAFLDPNYLDDSPHLALISTSYLAKVTDRYEFAADTIERIIDHCLVPISNRGDFVCRFALRQAIVAMRRVLPENTDQRLEDWKRIQVLEPADLGQSGEGTVEQEQFLASEILRAIAYVDALGQSDVVDDAWQLIECLRNASVDESESRFWLRRIAATSIVQFSRRQRQDLTPDFNRAMIHAFQESVQSAVSTYERAMLAEQLVYFLVAVQHDHWNWIADFAKDSTEFWPQVSVAFALISAHNETRRIESMPSNQAMMAGIQSSLQSMDEAFSKLVCQETWQTEIVARSRQGMQAALGQPERLISENDLFQGSAEWNAEAALDKVPIFFSPEFFSTYYTNHHECKERVYCLLDRFTHLNQNDDRLQGRFQYVEPPRVDASELTRDYGKIGPAVHERAYVEQVRELSDQLESMNDSRDRFQHLQVNIRPGSWGAALRSTGAVVAAADAALKTNGPRLGICLNRPPGHLATNQICIFNNVAIGVRHAQECLRSLHGKMPRMTVLDVDAHHGLHLQQTFYGDELVAYVSIHQENIHPGEGFVWQSGHDRRAQRPMKKGAGVTLNLPVPKHAGREQCLSLVQNELREHLLLHQPEMIFIACGADADWRDPFAELRFDPTCYWEYGRIVRSANVPVVVAFEGGFGITNGAIADSFEALIRGLLSDQPLPEFLRSEPPQHVKPDEPDDIRSIFCHRSRKIPQSSQRKLLSVFGDVRTVLDANVRPSNCRPLAFKRLEFGLGAGVCSTKEMEPQYDRIGEVLLIGGQPLVQCPLRQEVIRCERLITPFMIRWENHAPFWQRFRTHRPIRFSRMKQLLSQSLDVDATLFGVVGVLQLTPEKRLQDKRLSCSPIPGNADRFADRVVEEDPRPFILREGITEQFFTSGLPPAETFSETVIVAGIIHRQSGGNKDPLAGIDPASCFYHSPLAPETSSNDLNSHFHLLLSSHSDAHKSLLSIPTDPRTWGQELSRCVTSAVLVSHLEEAVVSDALFSIQPLDRVQRECLDEHYA